MQFGQGTGDGELTFPWGLSIDSQGNVWVASITSGRVLEFDKEGRYVTQLDSTGAPEGGLHAPMGLSVGPNGKVWVVDDASLWTAGFPGSRVEQFSAQGKYEGQLGALGSGEGQLSCPDGVAVDPKGHVWVADYCKGIVEEFNEAGRYLGHLGGQGTEGGQLARPQWVAVAPSGNIWVSDSGNDSVQEFKEKEGTSGQYEYVRKFGSEGAAKGQFEDPQGLAVDSQGHVWVADIRNHRVQEFKEDGEYLTEFGGGGSGEGQLEYPMGLAVDSNGSVWVSDLGNGRVEKWATVTVPSATVAVSSISPNHGPEAGGTSVTVTGTGFISGSTVKFGDTAATSVTVNSPTSITVDSPAGSGSVSVTVTNSGGTSASTPQDQFAYDPAPSGPWLGLNGNSGYSYLGGLTDFSKDRIVYDRSSGIEFTAGEEGSEQLTASINAGMIPVIPIEYAGYKGNWGTHDPNFPHTTAQINSYVSGFVTTAGAILRRYPGKTILFEPMNEPWGYTEPTFNATEYANVVAKVLPAAEAAGIPLSDIYVGAIGEHCPPSGSCEKNGWVRAMYAAQPSLKTEVGGWYFHPYGPPHGTDEWDNYGIDSLPPVRSTMTSGQNNIIVSEVGYEGNTTESAKQLTEMLDNALQYHEAGWLKALLVYSRGDGAWALQLPGGALTKQGEAFAAFAAAHG